MATPNVEVVRRANAAFNAHDIDGWMETLAEGLEVVDHMGAVGETEVSGVDALRRQVEEWFELFPDFRAELREVIDCGDHVVCETDWRGTARASGLPYHQPAAELLTIRDGRISRVEMGFEDKAAALAAVPGPG